MMSTLRSFVGWAISFAFPGLGAGTVAWMIWYAIGDWVACWVQQTICLMMRIFFTQFNWQIALVMDRLPQAGALDMSPMIQWYLLIDYYVPITFALINLGTVYGFVLGFRCFRFVKQFFPTWSN